MALDRMRFVLRCLLLLSLTRVISSATPHELRRVCYFTNWSCDLLVKEAYFCLHDIDVRLCSHIIYAFVGINVTSLSLLPSRVDDESKGDVKGRYVLFNELKNNNPKLKTLLSLGGSYQSQHFTNVSSSAASRKRFADNVARYVRKWGFNGLDLDWEYPGEAQKSDFTLLVQDLRLAFQREAHETGKEELMLSLAAPVSEEKVDKGYQVDKISKYVDMINLMAYDYYGAWGDITGFHSALYPRASDHRFSHKHCVEWTVKMWLNLGAPPHKINLGIAGYGQSFTLRTNSTTTGANVTSESEEYNATPSASLTSNASDTENLTNEKHIARMNETFTDKVRPTSSNRNLGKILRHPQPYIRVNAPRQRSLALESDPRNVICDRNNPQSKNCIISPDGVRSKRLPDADSKRRKLLEKSFSGFNGGGRHPPRHRHPHHRHHALPRNRYQRRRHPRGAVVTENLVDFPDPDVVNAFVNDVSTEYNTDYYGDTSYEILAEDVGGIYYDTDVSGHYDTEKPNGIIDGIHRDTISDTVSYVNPVYGVGAKALGPGKPGRLRHLDGQLSYPEICEMLQDGGVLSWDEEQRVPYASRGNQWVGFDDARSIAEKVKWASEQNLGGVMFWSLDLDDFTGDYCGQGRYPLLSAISDTVASLYNSVDNPHENRNISLLGVLMPPASSTVTAHGNELRPTFVPNRNQTRAGSGKLSDRHSDEVSPVSASRPITAAPVIDVTRKTQGKDFLSIPLPQDLATSHPSSTPSLRSTPTISKDLVPKPLSHGKASSSSQGRLNSARNGVTDTYSYVDHGPPDGSNKSASDMRGFNNHGQPNGASNGITNTPSHVVQGPPDGGSSGISVTPNYVGHGLSRSASNSTSDTPTNINHSSIGGASHNASNKAGDVNRGLSSVANNNISNTPSNIRPGLPGDAFVLGQPGGGTSAADTPDYVDLFSYPGEGQSEINNFYYYYIAFKADLHLPTTTTTQESTTKTNASPTSKDKHSGATSKRGKGLKIRKSRNSAAYLSANFYLATITVILLKLVSTII